MIQRRGHLGLPGWGDRPGHGRWRCGDRGLVVAALDGELQLERELQYASPRKSIRALPLRWQCQMNSSLSGHHGLRIRLFPPDPSHAVV